MAKISEQLADLSVHAKHAEDAVAAARSEARDKIMQRREQARSEAAAAMEKLDRNIKTAGDDMKSVGEAAAKKWHALQTKIAGDLDSVKSNIAQKKHDWDARRAKSHADKLEWEAGIAVDYAIIAVEQAELAVLDAVAGRMEAEGARSA